MLLIRNREEFKKQILEQEKWITRQLVTARGQKSIARINGMLHGISITKVALDAWEQFDRGEVLNPEVPAATEI